jgi:hypothetical protein
MISGSLGPLVNMVIRMVSPGLIRQLDLAFLERRTEHGHGTGSTVKVIGFLENDSREFKRISLRKTAPWETVLDWNLISGYFEMWQMPRPSRRLRHELKRRAASGLAPRRLFNESSPVPEQPA